jgi:hypothetical protein
MQLVNVNNVGPHIASLLARWQSYQEYLKGRTSSGDVVGPEGHIGFASRSELELRSLREPTPDR